MVSWLAVNLNYDLLREEPMFGGKGGLGNLMKQAQQMQEKMQQMQEEIAKLEVTGESGAGLVKVTINGAHNCRRVEIDPSLLEDDKDMLEDLVAAAFNDAACRALARNRRSAWRLRYCNVTAAVECAWHRH